MRFGFPRPPAAGPTVLVTDAHERAAVATCRGLLAAGYAVAAAASSRLAPAQWSRACRERLVLPDPLADGERYAEALAEIVAARPYDLLIPGSDQALLAISARRELFDPHTRTGLPRPEVVTRSLDKGELGAVASAVGLDAPTTVTCHDVSEALDAARRLGYPVLIKAERVVHRVGRATRRQASVRVEHPDDLARLVPLYGAPFLLQRCQPGTLVSYAGVRSREGLRARAAARYVRTWRPDFGMATFSTSIAPPQELMDRADRLLEAFAWEGIFQIQLIAGDDGSFAAIDLNPRPYGSMALALRAGVNIPGIWARTVLSGGSAEVVEARPGINYRWEDGDLRHLLWQLRRGRPNEAFRVLRPHRRVAHAYFKIDDPLPLLARVAAGRLRVKHEASSRGQRFQTRT